MPASRAKKQNEVQEQLEAQGAELLLLRQRVVTQDALLVQLGAKATDLGQRLETVTAERDDLSENLKAERSRHSEKDYVGHFQFSPSRLYQYTYAELTHTPPIHRILAFQLGASRQLQIQASRIKNTFSARLPLIS